MKISVIIPCHNHAQVVGEAVQSALDQTMPPHEVIVVDDGSTDDIDGSVQRYKDDITFIRQPRSGPSAARNAAARKATGEWLALLDADDLWLPQKLEHQAGAIQERAHSPFVYTDGWLIDGLDLPELRPEQAHFRSRTPPQGPRAYELFLTTPILTSSVMIKKREFDQEGGFDQSFWMHEDADLFLRIMAQGHEVVFVPEPLMVQRCTPEGLGRDRDTYLASNIRMLQKARQRFAELDPLFRKSLATTHKYTALYALKDRDYEKARVHWKNMAGYRRPGLRGALTALLLRGGGRPGGLLARRLWKHTISKLI